MLELLTYFFPQIQSNDEQRPRRHERREVNLPVTIKAIIDYQLEIQTLHQHAMILNLSERGALIQMNQMLAASHLYASYGDDESKAMRCRIAHQNKVDATGQVLVGVEFEELVDCLVFDDSLL